MPWELTGNAGTNPTGGPLNPGDFLGTTDNQPLAIRTNNAERLRVNPNGNVVIGAMKAAQKLTLGSGNIGLPNANLGTDGNLYFGGITDAGQTGMRLFGGNVNNAIPAGFIDIRTTDPKDGLRIRVDTGVGATERMRITAEGNVGIGTTNPSTGVPGGRALHIHNPTGASALRLGDGAANGQQWEWQSTVIGTTGVMNLSTPPANHLIVTSFGQMLLPGRAPGPAGGVNFPGVPIGTLQPRPPTPPPTPSPPEPGELVLGATRTSIRGFDRQGQNVGGDLSFNEDPTKVGGLRIGYHWIRTNGNDQELWIGFKKDYIAPLPGKLDRTLHAAAPGGWYAPSYNGSSDARMKTNVHQVDGALDKLERIRGVAFEWAETESPYALGGVPGQSGVGVLAQEVEEVFPELVTIYTPEEEYKAVDYNGLTSTLIEAVKELKAQIEALLSRIEALEGAQQ
jgi:hypothetical protein